MHFDIHGQWWSKPSIQISHLSQWKTFFGLKTLHFSQYLPIIVHTWFSVRHFRRDCIFQGFPKQSLGMLSEEVIQIRDLWLFPKNQSSTLSKNYKARMRWQRERVWRLSWSNLNVKVGTIRSKREMKFSWWKNDQISIGIFACGLDILGEFVCVLFWGQLLHLL